MRLSEITEPHPRLAAAASLYADVYRRLFEDMKSCLRSIPGAKVLEDRVVFELRPRESDPEAESEERVREVEEALEPYGWKVTDWVGGYARRYDGRIMRIGRLLNSLVRTTALADWEERERERRIRAREKGLDTPDPDDIPEPFDPKEAERLLRLWESDPLRRGHGREKHGRFVAVLTFDPVENVHMSTRRGWVTCRTYAETPEERARYPGAGGFFEPGEAAVRILCEIEHGIAVLWLTREDDALTLDHPVGRTVLRLVRRGHTLVPLVQESYGTLPWWWAGELRRIVRAIHSACVRIGAIYEPLDVDRPEARHLLDTDPENVDSDLIPAASAQWAGPPDALIDALARGDRRRLEDIGIDTPAMLRVAVAHAFGSSPDRALERALIAFRDPLSRRRARALLEPVERPGGFVPSAARLILWLIRRDGPPPEGTADVIANVLLTAPPGRARRILALLPPELRALVPEEPGV